MTDTPPPDTPPTPAPAAKPLTRIIPLRLWKRADAHAKRWFMAGVALCVAIAVIAFLVATFAGATDHSQVNQGPGLSMAAGENDVVTCGGPQLAVLPASATGLSLQCAPIPTTTTTTTPASTTTTTPASTTTTVPATTTTVPATTTTTAPSTTTTTTPVQSGFPTAGGNDGVKPGVVLTTYTGPTTITSCGTVIDSKLITSPITVNVGNGNEAIYKTEAAAKAAACVTFTNDLFKPATCGNGCAGIYTGFTTYAGGATSCVSKTGKACGPVYVADSEFSMPQSSSAGYNYTTYDTNLHAWRVYIHGTDQGIDSDGYSEVHDSYLAADRCNVGCTTHGDAFFQDGGAPALVDHNTLICGGTAGFQSDCSGDIGFYGDNSAVANMTVTNNQFLASTGQFFYCGYSGASQPSKPFPTGNHLTWTGNVFQKGPSGKCGDAGPMADWADGNSNVWSGNTYSDGTPLNL